MFTGIVEELGEVVGKQELGDSARLVIRGPVVTADAGHGVSIAVNGVCLTVVDGDRKTLAFDAVPETLARTTLGRLAPGSSVNLEPALRAGVGRQRAAPRLLAERGQVGRRLVEVDVGVEHGRGAYWITNSVKKTLVTRSTLSPKRCS